MAEKRRGTTARGTSKKAGSRKKAPSKSAPQNAAASEGSQQRGAAKKAATRKNAAPRAAAKKARPGRHISPEERYRLIQEAAYLKAEEEGFTRDPSECWLIAEAEVHARLADFR
jgi:hypothetical protein